MYFDPFGLDKAENQRRANAMRGLHRRDPFFHEASIFGCFGVHCVSGNEYGARHTATFPTIGGGFTLCTKAQEPTSCEQIESAKEKGFLYPPGNGNKGVVYGRFGISVEQWQDGRFCISFGPHVALPFPTPIADGGDAMPGSY
jgi:hypothetical protein